MLIKSEKDFWSGLMFVGLGAGFAIGSLEYNFGSSARPGPAYFPFGLGILLAILGALVLFKAMTFEVEGGDRVGSWAWRPLLIVMFSVAGFGWALPRLGMFITLPLLIIIAAMASDQFRLKEAVVSAAILTGACWFIFIYGLSLTIPLYPNFR